MKPHAKTEDPAGFDLRYESRPGFLFVEVTGTRSTPDAALAALHQLAAECVRLRVRKVLIADHASGRPNQPPDMVRTVRALQDSPLAKLRVAYYVRSVENVPFLQHAELEALDFGFDLRVFANLRDAEIWLSHGP
ncbi:MAG: hypothetical protein JSS28_01910 [Proteobacteria bacterium]|nr:hypothetical protein [Pseudomonadota bacterium]